MTLALAACSPIAATMALLGSGTFSFFLFQILSHV
jgi:hypothetical protein